MWINDDFKDYELLDATDGERLERWGHYVLIRPDPQIIWRTPRTHPRWKTADALYKRSANGGGSWSDNNLPTSWSVSWRDLHFIVKPTGFKHTGLFPEQASNWDMLDKLVRSANRPLRPLSILNLFAYTGAASIVCANAGAKVTHVDAAKGMVAWARDNARINTADARWIVDDCEAFVERELRRGNRYDAVIMDPPSYGRGTGGQIWKIEDNLYDLLKKTVALLSDDAQFFLLNAYTTGLAPSVLRYLLETLIVPRFGGRAEAGELGLRVGATELFLPSGAAGRWIR